MPDTLDAAQYKLPLDALVEAIESVEWESDWSKLQAAHDEALAALRNRRGELDTLYERAIAPDTNWEEIAQVASTIGAWREAAAEKLYPQIGALQQNSGLRMATSPGRLDKRCNRVSKSPKLGWRSIANFRTSC